MVKMTAPGEAAEPSTFDLRIADPVSLLNEIARRYESSERILMEYVDNALDDAEVLYRNNGGIYPYPILIAISLDPRERYITIRDNCRGMRRDVLERVVVNVGESQKRGITWVNGQFGFGVHAFRAAANAIRFRTQASDGPHLELRLARDQDRDIRRPWVRAERFPSDTGTGTEVTIGYFEEEWFETVTVESIKREIEDHFERLLARPRLSITVDKLMSQPVSCEPFEYATIPGTDFQRPLEISVGGRPYRVEVHLRVSDIQVPGRAARFFARGRRINEVAEIKSFIRKSVSRTSVWGHPNLLGYIEVGEIVKPVITRDDFQRSKGRTALYEGILSLEPHIKQALDRVKEAQRDTTLTRLEDVLRDVLNDLARQDRLRLRSELTAGREPGTLVAGGAALDGSEGGPTGDGERGGDGSGSGESASGPDPALHGPRSGSADGGTQVTDDATHDQGQRRTRAGFDIKFRNLPPDIDRRLPRSQLVDGVISINTAHPDFNERMLYGRQGQPRFSDRLGAYLAATISIHYKDQFYERYGKQPERRDQLFDEQVDFMCRLEAALKPHLPALQEEFAGEAPTTDA